MLVQITSGRGPIECELAVGLYLDRLRRLHPSIVVQEEHRGPPVDVAGRKLVPYKSILLDIPEGEFPATGTVQWICPSPVRKGHRRKNWFIKVAAVADDACPGAYSHAGLDRAQPDKRLLRVETFRSPGKGGQNVNKVETGVRITHVPTGLVGASVTARTQGANKKLALERLRTLLAQQREAQAEEKKATQWSTHNAMQRGCAVAVFHGLDFIPEDCTNGR